MEKQIKINNLYKKLGSVLLVNGIQILRKTHSLRLEKKSFGFIADSIKNVVNISPVQRDLHYYLPSKTDAMKIIDIVAGIMKNFKWQRDYSDCDDRSKMVSALFSFLFKSNCCGELYNEFKVLGSDNIILHWNNVIITKEGDFILFDADNNCQSIAMTKDKPFTMGTWTYQFKSIRF